MKHMRLIFFLFIFTTARLWAEEASTATLADLLLLAQERNPKISASFQKWKVLEKEAQAIATWPNPKLTYIDEKDPMGQENVDPMTRKHYSVEQEVPFPGKLTKESKMKKHEALIAEADFKSVLLDVQRQIKIAYEKMASLDRLIALLKTNTNSMRRTLTITQNRLAANQGMASDVFLAQVELRRMENMAFEKERERRSAEIELNSLLDYDLNKTWSVPSTMPELIALPMNISDLQSLAEQNNPQFHAAHHEVNHSRAMLARSRFEYAPDFGLMYEYQTAGDGSGGTGPAGRQLGLSLSIPLWLKRQLNLSGSANAHVKEAEAQARDMEIMIRKMVAMEENETTTHLKMAQRISDEILPPAQAALTTTREQYAAGRGDFLRMLEANRAWISVHLEHEEQLFQYVQHWSELERWVGTSLSNTPKEKNHEE